MTVNLFAYTTPEGELPGFVSINRDEHGDVTVTLRSAPSYFNGKRVCMNKPRQWSCTPGGFGCNNYCNYDHSQPMADSPEPCVHIKEGVTSSFTVPAGEWKL